MATEEDGQSSKCCTKPAMIPARYVLALMGHLGLAVAYGLRVNLSVALVAMVNSTYADAQSSAQVDPECKRGLTRNTTNFVNVSI